MPTTVGGAFRHPVPPSHLTSEHPKSASNGDDWFRFALALG